MVRAVIILILLITLGIGGFMVLNERNTPGPTPTPIHLPMSPAPSVSQQNGPVLCEPEQLAGSITTEPAAGNIYGSLVLTNVSAAPCSVTLGSSITATYQAKNITLKYQQAPAPQELTLQPSEKAYAQVHYPNGPQCSGPTVEQPVQFLYEVDGKTVPFQDATSKKERVIVQACSASTDITTIDIWPLSRQPIVP